MMAKVIAPPTPMMKGVSMVCGENASARVKAVGSVNKATKNCQKVVNDCGNEPKAGASTVGTRDGGRLFG